MATQRIGIIGAAEADGPAVPQLDPEIRLIGVTRPIRAGHFLENLPGDAFGLFIGGRYVPNQTPRFPGGSAQLHHGQISFAETAACDEDAEPRSTVEYFPLRWFKFNHGC